MNPINQTPALYQPDEAERNAAQLQECEDCGWTYTADHAPEGNGYSRVKVYDERGEFVAYWSEAR